MVFELAGSMQPQMVVMVFPLLGGCLFTFGCLLCVCTRNTFITLSIQCGNVYNLNVAVIVLEIDNKERKLQ